MDTLSDGAHQFAITFQSALRVQNSGNQNEPKNEAAVTKKHLGTEHGRGLSGSRGIVASFESGFHSSPAALPLSGPSVLATTILRLEGAIAIFAVPLAPPERQLS